MPVPDFTRLHCLACGEHHYHPRAICPHCFSDQTAYAIAYVTLADGVPMRTNIVDCDLDALAIGQAMRVAFKPSEGGPQVAMFTPVLRRARPLWSACDLRRRS